MLKGEMPQSSVLDLRLKAKVEEGQVVDDGLLSHVLLGERKATE